VARGDLVALPAGHEAQLRNTGVKRLSASCPSSVAPELALAATTPSMTTMLVRTSRARPVCRRCDVNRKLLCADCQRLRSRPRTGLMGAHHLSAYFTVNPTGRPHGRLITPRRRLREAPSVRGPSPVDR
jgi:hypothetical protein